MNPKQEYRKLCKIEPMIPLPSKDWWLDAVAGDHYWDVVIVENNGDIIASLPYVLKRVFLFKIILMPRFTPSMGVWIKYPENQKYLNKLAYEKKICTELIRQLPSFHRFHQRFHDRFTNWLPFYWQGFEQTTRYVYIIENLSNLEAVFANLRENIRREIRKAQKQLTVKTVESIDALYRLIRLTYQRQNKELPFSQDFLQGIDLACVRHNCRKILIAEDEEGNIHSALYLVWDSETAYYLIGGSNPKFRTSGAASLLMWNAIRFASTVTHRFNFCGSMIESIERFFRAFGGIQTPYFAIYKNSYLFKLLDTCRKM